jgi:hypothetical protein
MKNNRPSNRHPKGLMCPFCENVMDATTCVSVEGTKRPVDDDVTMCITCGEIAMFATKPLRLRKPTDAEYVELAADEQVQKMRTVWVEHKRAEKNAKDKAFNTFRPWTEEFETALDTLVGDDRQDIATMSWRLFFYTGALVAYGRIGKLQGGYGDFMMAIRRMIEELQAELQAVHDDGVKLGIYSDAPEDAP